MGGYSFYFTNHSSLAIGTGHSVHLQGYEQWEKDVMTLVRFKKICSAFHPESGKSTKNNKCHQLQYFIRIFNFMARDVFYIRLVAAFDEGGIAIRIRYFRVQQYNKDVPAKYQLDFFLLAETRYYNIYHLDCYQGKNREILTPIQPFTSYLQEKRQWLAPS